DAFHRWSGRSKAALRSAHRGNGACRASTGSCGSSEQPCRKTPVNSCRVVLTFNAAARPWTAVLVLSLRLLQAQLPEYREGVVAVLLVSRTAFALAAVHDQHAVRSRRHQRQGEDQLVLHQVRQRHLPVGRDQQRFVTRRQRRLLFLAADQAQPQPDRHRLPVHLEGALAHQRQLTLRTHLDVGLVELVGSELDLAGDGTFGTGQAVTQAWQRGQIELAREDPTPGHHAPDVDLIGQPARHKADMLTATQRRVNSRSSMPTVVLASTSPYRRALLQRILTGFSTAAPPVDESRLDGETPGDMAARLATAKARAVAAGHPGAVVIG